MSTDLSRDSGLYLADDSSAHICSVAHCCCPTSICNLAISAFLMFCSGTLPVFYAVTSSTCTNNQNDQSCEDEQHFIWSAGEGVTLYIGDLLPWFVEQLLFIAYSIT